MTTATGPDRPGGAHESGTHARRRRRVSARRERSPYGAPDAARRSRHGGGPAAAQAVPADGSGRAEAPRGTARPARAASRPRRCSSARSACGCGPALSRTAAPGAGVTLPAAPGGTSLRTAISTHAAGRGEAFVVAGVRVRHDLREAADLAGALVEQGEDGTGAGLAAAQRAEGVHQRGDGGPYPLQEGVEIRHVAGEVVAGSMRRGGGRPHAAKARTAWSARRIQSSVAACVLTSTTRTATTAPRAPTAVSPSRRASSPGWRMPSRP